jgi:hypothetical protein
VFVLQASMLVTLGGCHLLDDLVDCGSVEVRKENVHSSGEGFVRGIVLTVTTPSEIIPYYRLNHSFWSLSDNKKSSC